MPMEQTVFVLNGDGQLNQLLAALPDVSLVLELTQKPAVTAAGVVLNEASHWQGTIELEGRINGYARVASVKQELDRSLTLDQAEQQLREHALKVLQTLVALYS